MLLKIYGWRWGNFEFVVCLSKRGSAERIVVGWCYASWQALMENEVLTSLSLEGNRVHNSVWFWPWGVECVFSVDGMHLPQCFSRTTTTFDYAKWLCSIHRLIQYMMYIHLFGLATQTWILTYFLGGGFNYFFMFIPKFGEDEPMLTSIFFQMGWFNHQPVLFLYGYQTQVLKVGLVGR